MIFKSEMKFPVWTNYMNKSRICGGVSIEHWKSVLMTHFFNDFGEFIPKQD